MGTGDQSGKKKHVGKMAARNGSGNNAKAGATETAQHRQRRRPGLTESENQDGPQTKRTGERLVASGVQRLL